jgi:hypothetical protein
MVRDTIAEQTNVPIESLTPQINFPLDLKLQADGWFSLCPPSR